ncbi:HHE domain-containing protein [Paraphaeosphaeria sporulosa]
MMGCNLTTLLEQHITEEERDDLPKFEKALNNEDGVSTKLATNFQRTKAFIPTRSQPSAGEVCSITLYHRAQAYVQSESRI